MTTFTRSCAMMDRREVTKLMIVVSVAAAASPFKASDASDRAPRFNDGGEELRAFMKLQTRVDNGYTNYLNSGTVYAALPGRPSVPMYAYEGLLRFHTRVLDGNRYAVSYVEAGTYLDLKTNQRLDRFSNPLTGVDDIVQHIVEGPFSWQWSADNLHDRTPAPVLIRDVAWQHFGGRSSLRFDNLLSVSAPGGPIRHAAALVTYVGTTSEIDDASSTSVLDTTLIDSSINPWVDWLAMGDAPGRLANDIIGRKLGALSEVPDRLLRHIAAERPGVLEGVDAWNSFR